MISNSGADVETATKQRGRPIGATSWWRNPRNIAALYSNVLLELWLAAVPVVAIRRLLSSVADSPEYRALIEECWRERGNEGRSTVPKPIKRKLCQLAIAYLMKVREQYQAATPRVKAILRRSREAATAKLRDRGWTDEQIARWFNKRDIALRRGAKDFKTPSLKKVVEIVSRSAPEDTLRRKAASRKLRRKIQAA